MFRTYQGAMALVTTSITSSVLEDDVGRKTRTTYALSSLGDGADSRVNSGER